MLLLRDHRHVDTQPRWIIADNANAGVDEYSHLWNKGVIRSMAR